MGGHFGDVLNVWPNKVVQRVQVSERRVQSRSTPSEAKPGSLWTCGPALSPVIRGNPDLHFEGAGNGPVVITWIGREHELYSCASPISLVEHCVTFRHDRRILSLLAFVNNWPTSRWSATKKGKPVFIKRKWNHVVFSRATILSFHPVISTSFNYLKLREHVLVPRRSISIAIIVYTFREKNFSCRSVHANA